MNHQSPLPCSQVLASLSVMICTALTVISLSACSNAPLNIVPSNTQVFRPSERSDKVAFPDRRALAEFEAETDPIYLLGEGDRIDVQVWGRAELTGKHTLGPDGRISIPLAGPLKLSALTREEAAEKINVSLKKYYTAPAVTLSVDQYTSNRVTVLGRVQNPGIITFDRQATLLETLARAGALPVMDKQATLTRCAIFRGREKVIWIDLKHLLTQSDPSYNIRLKPNDLIYIPDSNDTSVYVLGSVVRPGTYRLTPDMSVLDALAQAGGPNEDGAIKEIGLYRANRQAMEIVPLASLLTGERKLNFALEEGDVIYVPKTGIAEFGYVLRQLLPGLSFLTFGLSAAPTSNK
ncbi:SLBB domain-containing protein [Undibacterium sp.]|uniref:SLBB domain-containing protein n=1 Tax=Undibacterium sp. TaxID=1914977 RepID=UPI00375392F8